MFFHFPVHSIANEYIRDREQHDNTAKLWTSLYAKPPPPETSKPSVSKAKGKQPADRANRNKGKTRTTRGLTSHDASSSRHNSVVVGSRGASTTGTRETIEISDSEEEFGGTRDPEAQSMGRKRRSDLAVDSDQESTRSTKKRNATRRGSFVDLAAEFEECDVQSSKPKNGRHVRRSGRTPARSSEGSQTRPSGSRLRSTDVIVID
jgi:hypothetical protein